MCYGGKVERNVPMQNGFFQFRVEISTLVVLDTGVNNSSVKVWSNLILDSWLYLGSSFALCF